jgi:GH24 family phage-related lysozyme (muramidase)
MIDIVKIVQQCYDRLPNNLKNCPWVATDHGRLVLQTEEQLDALVSFAFNLGIARLRDSTLLKLIRKGGSKNAIRQEFKRWVYAGGKKLRGLEIRREWEAKRFFE